MSYDLMVFEPTAAPRDRLSFVEWYHDQTSWSEHHSYDDPKVTSPRLAAWFMDMIKVFPPMNGPFRSDDVDNPKLADYSIGSVVIYAGFRWSEVEPAYAEIRRLATIHRVGFYDVSGTDQIVFPPD